MPAGLEAVQCGSGSRRLANGRGALIEGKICNVVSFSGNPQLLTSPERPLLACDFLFDSISLSCEIPLKLVLSCRCGNRRRQRRRQRRRRKETGKASSSVHTSAQRSLHFRRKSREIRRARARETGTGREVAQGWSRDSIGSTP